MLTLRFAFLASSLALAGSALAEFTFYDNYSDTRTLFKSTSGFDFGFATYDGTLVYNDTTGNGASGYINGLNVVKGAGFDPNIVVDVPTQFSGYTFGTAIADGATVGYGSIASLDVSSGANAALGTYDFSVQILGGGNASATDVLSTLNYHVEVFGGLNISVSGTATDLIIGGAGSALNMTVKNNMATRNFVSTSWFEGGYGYTDPLDPTTPHYLDGDFVFTPGWFNKGITPGASLTAAHSIYYIKSTNTSVVPGVYTGRNGVVGGLHNGDYYYVNMDPSPTITVRAVPEPASMAILGLGVFALQRRRRV